MQQELQASDIAQISIHGKRLSVCINGMPVNVSALARKLGMDQGNLSKFLSGQRQYTPTLARIIADELDMTVDALLDSIHDRRTQKLA